MTDRNSALYDEDFHAWTQERARRERGSRLAVLLLHLLQWRCRPGTRLRSWSATIDEQRLPKFPRDSSVARSPGDRPFTPDEALARDFLPEG